MADGAKLQNKAAEPHAHAGTNVLKTTVEKSLGLLNDLNAESKSNLEAVVASVTTAAKGAEALGAELAAFTKKSMEDNIVAAKALSGARSIPEVIELQTNWARSTMEAYIAGFNQASGIVSASLKDSLRPINDRVTATVEKLQVVR